MFQSTRFIVKRISVCFRACQIQWPHPQEMSSQERFARGFLTLKSSLGAATAWDFWQRLSDAKSEATLAKGDAKKIEKVLKSAFSDAWTAAAPNAKTKKAKLAAKKTPAQVGRMHGLVAAG